MVWLTGYHCPPNGKDREKFRKTLFSFIDTAMTYDFLKYDADFVFQWSDEFKGYRIGMMNVKPFRIIAPK